MSTAQGQRARDLSVRQVGEAVSAANQRERETHSIPEASARLGFGKTLGYELARRGEFPVPIIRAGRRLLVPKAGVDQILLGNLIPQHSDAHGSE